MCCLCVFYNDLLTLYACVVIMMLSAGEESKLDQSESGSLATDITLRADLGEKRIDGEQEATAAALVVTMQKRLDETGVARRGDHGKPHACLQGTFAVMPSVQGTALAVGIASPTAAGEIAVLPSNL